MPIGQPGLPPELEALKRTVRQIIKDECAPQEAYFLANPSFEGDDDGGPGGIAEALMGIVGTLSPSVWQRLTAISKETGIYTDIMTLRAITGRRQPGPTMGKTGGWRPL